MRSSRSPTSFGTRTHAVTCALWTSSAAGRSTIVSIQLPPGRNDHAVAQGPQERSSLTVVLAAQSGVPGRPRTPNSKQAHGHQGKENGVAGDPGIIAPFMRPRASAKRTDELNAVVSGHIDRAAGCRPLRHSPACVRPYRRLVAHTREPRDVTADPDAAIRRTADVVMRCVRSYDPA